MEQSTGRIEKVRQYSSIQERPQEMDHREHPKVSKLRVDKLLKRSYILPILIELFEIYTINQVDHTIKNTNTRLRDTKFIMLKVVMNRSI